MHQEKTCLCLAGDVVHLHTNWVVSIEKAGSEQREILVNMWAI